MSKKSLLLQIHKDLAAGELRLPTLPEVSLRIKKAATNPETDIASLSKVVESDPGLCGYLLQIANSPIYRGNVNIQKVHLAISRLGLQNTCNIAMTYAVRALFSPNRKLISGWLKKIWNNSTYTASVACVIAEESKHKFDPDEAVLAGLLQDIGCLPLIDKAALYPELIDDERAMLFLFDRYAATIGSAILMKWGLPAKFIEVVRHRDHWKYNEVNQATLTDLVLIAKLHTYLGQKLLIQPPRMNRIPAFVKLQLGANLSPEKSLQFVADAKQKIAETCATLGSR